MAFLLMLGIQARIIPWTITNNIGVDAKRDFSILGQGEVKVQVSANMQKNIIYSIFFITKCYQYEQKHMHLRIEGHRGLQQPPN